MNSASDGPVRLRGVVERILFHNAENGYTVVQFRANEGREPVTLTGTLPGVRCGETLLVEGTWSSHATHGAQFRVATFRSELPSSVYGIRKFLGSGLVKGIGAAYADKIVGHFGEDTLRILNADAERLREVDGIGRARAMAIQKAWEEHRVTRETYVFLQGYGISNAVCLRLLKRYGVRAPAQLREDPYAVAREVHGIGFRTADQIALNLGMPSDGPSRIEAGVLHVLDELEEEGHTAAALGDAVARAARLLGAQADPVRARIRDLVERGQLRESRGLLQTPALDRAEARLAASVQRLARARSVLPPIRVDAAIPWAEARGGIGFSPEQAAAVGQGLTHTFSLLTGGPGTGKTTILRALVAILTAKKARVHLAAPTGRAAQRLAEVTGGRAQTIHRLLRLEPGKAASSIEEGKLLTTDFLIVDEASMLDTWLAAALLAAVPPGAHVLLVGDTDQLPSVGPGDVLRDLIAARAGPVTCLERVFRQGAGSGIVTTAHAVNAGDPRPPRAVRSPAEIDPAADLVFLQAIDPPACSRAVVEVCRDHLPRMGFDPVRDVQVLAPMHKGDVGVAALNFALQRALNPRAGAAGGFAEGDKVIQLRNDYERGVFNGDIGRIVGAGVRPGTWRIRFDDVDHEYDREALGDVTLAYAVSIHKSQGSEYPAVVIPLVRQHFIMLTRNLLYTALTRGRRLVVLVGDPAAYAVAVRTADTRVRVTRLRERFP